MKTSDQRLKEGFLRALKSLLRSPEPDHLTDWNPDPILAVEPGAQKHFQWNPEPIILKFGRLSTHILLFLSTDINKQDLVSNIV